MSQNLNIDSKRSVAEAAACKSVTPHSELAGRPKYWCKDINNEVYIMHGMHDTLSPFTESIKLDSELSNSHLFISGIFKHRVLSSEISIFSKWKETLKIILFLSQYYKGGLLP